MSNSLLKKYKKKLDLLDKYNKFYYQNQEPLVSDRDYDNLKFALLQKDAFDHEYFSIFHNLVFIFLWTNESIFENGLSFHQ